MAWQINLPNAQQYFAQSATGSYIKGIRRAVLENLIREKCSAALPILDRFHIVAKMNKALDEVRAEETRRIRHEGLDPVLRKSRWLLNRPQIAHWQRIGTGRGDEELIGPRG